MSDKIASETLPQIARMCELEMAVVVAKSVVVVVVAPVAPVVVTGHSYISHGQPLGQPAFLIK